MKKELERLQKDFQKALRRATDTASLDAIEQEFFSRKSGALSLVMKGLKNVSGKERKEIGRHANAVKQELEEAFQDKRQEIMHAAMADQIKHERIDVTQPRLPRQEVGHLHPITQAVWEMERVARSMGFIVEDGPELESDYYAFESLNIPKHHPARDSQDTFYIKGHTNWCMRPHVSNMQVRLMRTYNEKGTQPVRLAYPGRCFRNEATDATHEHTFYQYESLVVDRQITIGHLVGIIKELLAGLFQKDVRVRARPGYFPFVEPGFEMDMSCFLCDQAGCSVCKKTGWVEMLGCGLVHPNVMREAGYDPTAWNGLAFGMGLDRLVMLKYGIEDIRHFRSGDLRFVQQF